MGCKNIDLCLLELRDPCHIKPPPDPPVGHPSYDRIQNIKLQYSAWREYSRSCLNVEITTKSPYVSTTDTTDLVQTVTNVFQNVSLNPLGQSPPHSVSSASVDWIIPLVVIIVVVAIVVFIVIIVCKTCVHAKRYKLFFCEHMSIKRSSNGWLDSKVRFNWGRKRSYCQQIDIPDVMAKTEQKPITQNQVVTKIPLDDDQGVSCDSKVEINDLSPERAITLTQVNLIPNITVDTCNKSHDSQEAESDRYENCENSEKLMSKSDNSYNSLDSCMNSDGGYCSMKTSDVSSENGLCNMSVLGVSPDFGTVEGGVFSEHCQSRHFTPHYENDQSRGNISTISSSLNYDQMALDVPLAPDDHLSSLESSNSMENLHQVDSFVKADLDATCSTSLSSKQLEDGTVVPNMSPSLALRGELVDIINEAFD